MIPAWHTLLWYKSIFQSKSLFYFYTVINSYNDEMKIFCPSGHLIWIWKKFCQASIAYCIAWDFWGRSLSASRKPPRLSKRKPLQLPLRINTYLCQPHHKGLRLWGPYLFILNLPTLVAEWEWVRSLVLSHFTCWKTQITECSQLQATTNCII